jgi:AcrR family transcriptional regulator
MTQTERRNRSRNVILSAAARAIARDGYHGMSMRDLSRATGLGLASSYAHFASKEDILFALQSEAFDALIDGAERAVARASGASRGLYAFILNHLRFFAAHPDLLRVLVQEAGALPARKRALIRARKERYFAIARDQLAALVDGRGSERDAELERATYALFGMLNWVYGWYEPRRHGSPEALAETFHRITLRGAAAGGEGGRAS